MALTPVFQACKPRPAELTNDSYAADLHAALEKELATVESARDFFSGTYQTNAMRNACRMIFDRLRNGNSSNQPSVYRFNSRFGGGKSHTLIALAGASLYPQLVREEAELTPIPSEMATDGVKLVAFTGENIDPLSGTILDEDVDGARARSLAGFVAYHLGGMRALNEFREHDNRLTDPGAEAFRRLIGDTPTLILVDELVQWISRALQHSELNIAGAKTTIAALAKAVEICPRAVLVVTSPEPGHDAFQNETAVLTEVMSEADHILSRTAHDMVPSDETDIAAILRQRLFENCDETARKEAASVYGELMRRHRPDQGANAEDAFYHSYPFHPSILKITSERLADNPDFQRVRGTLRLLTATVTHNQDTTEGLIHPWHITPESSRIWDELINRLHHEAFEPAILADITSPNSTVNTLGDHLADKAAKTILLGSLAPSANSGLSVNEIIEAVITPEENDESVIRKSIQSVEDNALFIDTDPNRNAIRFTNEANIRREILLRRNSFSAPQIVQEETRAALQRTFAPHSNRRSPNTMPVTIYPSRTNNAPDDADQVHLAILNPGHINFQSPDIQRDLLDLFQHGPGNGGQAQREHRNNVIFLVAERDQDTELTDAIIRKLAAEDVKNSPPTILQDYQRQILEEVIATSAKHIHQAIQRNWIHLFFPSNDDQWVHASHLRHERLPAATDAEGDGQLTILNMLYAHHKMPQQEALRLNPTIWRETRLRNREPLTLAEIHREFTANPGRQMVLNRATFDKIIDAAIKAEELVVHTATGEVIGERHAGLHHGNDFKVWLPEYAPSPDPGPGPDPGPSPVPGPSPGPEPSPTGPEPPFQIWGESAKISVDRLTDHMKEKELDWSQVEKVTLQSAQLGFLVYIASLIQSTAKASFSYECHSDDSNISLTVRNRSAEQWMQESRTIERVNQIAGVTAGDAQVILATDDNTAESIRDRLQQMDNSYDIQLTAIFRPTVQEG